MHLANFPVSCTVLGPELEIDLDVHCPQEEAQCDQADDFCTHV